MNTDLIFKDAYLESTFEDQFNSYLDSLHEEEGYIQELEREFIAEQLYDPLYI